MLQQKNVVLCENGGLTLEAGWDIIVFDSQHDELFDQDAVKEIESE